MPGKPQKINIIMHNTDEFAVQNLKEASEKLYVRIVRKRLENSGLTAAEKREIIKNLIDDFKNRQP